MSHKTPRGARRTASPERGTGGRGPATGPLDAEGTPLTGMKRTRLLAGLHRGRQPATGSGRSTGTKFMGHSSSGHIFSCSFSASLRCFSSSVSFPISRRSTAFSCSRHSYSWGRGSEQLHFFPVLLADLTHAVMLSSPFHKNILINLSPLCHS